jgi:hypothetical protein
LGTALGVNTNTVTDLCVGDYFAVVTNGSGWRFDRHCECDTITDHHPHLSSIPASCAGTCDGVATVGPVGGVPPYIFDWTPDPPGGDSLAQATGLCAGVYTVSIADFTGCDTTISVLIVEPTPITANATINDVTCAGDCNGGIVVTAAGGTPPYNYDWTPDPPNGDGGNGAFDLCAGDWDLTITDNNGCATSFTWTVNEPAPIALSGSAVPSECQLCIGQAAVFVSGGTPRTTTHGLIPMGS